MQLRHLEKFGTYLHGPIQQDEALFLYAVVKMIRPKTILEFGVQNGFSTWNFALAKDPECFLFSFDKEAWCIEEGNKKVEGIPNCLLAQKDCRNFTHADVNNKPVDLCFLDCAHDFEINKVCIESFMPCMAPTGIVALHDTGIFTKIAFDAAPEEYKNTANGKFVEAQIAQHGSRPAVPAERKTANWILEAYPDYSQIHFHSANFFRNGITLIQRKGRLEV